MVRLCKSYKYQLLATSPLSFSKNLFWKRIVFSTLQGTKKNIGFKLTNWMCCKVCDNPIVHDVSLIMFALLLVMEIKVRLNQFVTGGFLIFWVISEWSLYWLTWKMSVVHILIFLSHLIVVKNDFQVQILACLAIVAFKRRYCSIAASDDTVMAFDCKLLWLFGISTPGGEEISCVLNSTFTICKHWPLVSGNFNTTISKPFWGKITGPSFVVGARNALDGTVFRGFFDF